jgi:hypothetical protein
MHNGASAKEIGVECAKYGISSGIVIVISNLWTKYFTKIIEKLLKETMTSNKLVDVDWLFGVTASSNDCNQVIIFHPFPFSENCLIFS